MENLLLTRPNLQQLMFEDVCAFRPECRAMAPGGRGGDPSPASTEFSDVSINSPALGGVSREAGGKTDTGAGATSTSRGEAKRREGSEGEFVSTSTVTAVKAAT